MDTGAKSDIEYALYRGAATAASCALVRDNPLAASVLLEELDADEEIVPTPFGFAVGRGGSTGAFSADEWAGIVGWFDARWKRATAAGDEDTRQWILMGFIDGLPSPSEGQSDVLASLSPALRQLVDWNQHPHLWAVKSPSGSSPGAIRGPAGKGGLPEIPRARRLPTLEALAEAAAEPDEQLHDDECGCVPGPGHAREVVLVGALVDGCRALVPWLAAHVVGNLESGEGAAVHPAWFLGLVAWLGFGPQALSEADWLEVVGWLEAAVAAGDDVEVDVVRRGFVRVLVEAADEAAGCRDGLPPHLAALVAHGSKDGIPRERE